MELLKAATLFIHWFPSASNTPDIHVRSNGLYDATIPHENVPALELHAEKYPLSYIGLRKYGDTGLCSYGLFSPLEDMMCRLRETRIGHLGDKEVELLSWGASRPSYINQFLPAALQVAEATLSREPLNGRQFACSRACAFTQDGLQVVARRLLDEQNTHLLVTVAKEPRCREGAYIVPSLSADSFVFPPECYASKANDIERHKIIVGSVCAMSKDTLSEYLAGRLTE